MKQRFLIGFSVFFLFFAITCGGPLVSPDFGNPDDEEELPNPQPRPLPPDFAETVVVHGGTFRLGEDLGGGLNIAGHHEVRLTSFRMGRYPVTQQEFYEIMGFDPSLFVTDDHPDETNVSPRAPAAPGENGLRRPAEQVSWAQAIVFCNKLTIRRGEGLTLAYHIPSISASRDPGWWDDLEGTGNVPDEIWDTVAVVEGSTGYRLPTEAQWEFAAKGGNNQSPYSFSGGADLDEVAWYAGNSAEGHTFTQFEGRGTHQVGRKPANALGIYDMSGNVVEYLWDWFLRYIDPEFPSGNADGEIVDPTGPPKQTTSRAFRGGSWDSAPGDMRLVTRWAVNEGHTSEGLPNGYSAGGVDSVMGFRVARPE